MIGNRLLLLFEAFFVRKERSHIIFRSHKIQISKTNKAKAKHTKQQTHQPIPTQSKQKWFLVLSLLSLIITSSVKITVMLMLSFKLLTLLQGNNANNNNNVVVHQYQFHHSIFSPPHLPSMLLQPPAVFISKLSSPSLTNSKTRRRLMKQPHCIFVRMTSNILHHNSSVRPYRNGWI